jgi:hypothetical protein
MPLPARRSWPAVGRRLLRAPLAVGRRIARAPAGIARGILRVPAAVVRGGRGVLPRRAARRLLGRPAVAVAVLFGAALGMGADAPQSYLTASRISALSAPGPVSSDYAVASSTTEVAMLLGARERGPHRGGPAYYRRTTHERVAPGTAAQFLPLYREAERAYGVSWRLIASIHRQETAFSQAGTTYHGLNAFGCCAGPMQFNVTNGPVSTWERYRQAFRAGERPDRYPHETRHHPSIYDDFDAIMAAGSLLRASGAGAGLDGAAWSAAYAYYGHDLFGVTYASQVLARAAAWERDGFCANCEPDAGLVEEFESAYGAAIREELLAEERRKKKKHKKHHKHDKAHKLAREAAAARVEAERAARRDDARRRAAAPEASPPSRERPPADAPPPPPADTATTTAPAAPPPPPPPPPPPVCTGVHKLLGC